MHSSPKHTLSKPPSHSYCVCVHVCYFPYSEMAGLQSLKPTKWRQNLTDCPLGRVMCVLLACCMLSGDQTKLA